MKIPGSNPGPRISFFFLSSFFSSFGPPSLSALLPVLLVDGLLDEGARFSRNMDVLGLNARLPLDSSTSKMFTSHVRAWAVAWKT